MDALSDTLRGAPQELGELCDVLLDTFGKGKTDDIALLAARLL